MLKKQPLWRKPCAFTHPALTSKVRKQLLDRGSLTRHLRKRSQRAMRVRVLEESWQFPHPGERIRLNLPPRSIAWVRRVELSVDEVPWIYAWTIFPAATLRVKGKPFRRLGEHSLGDVLFREPNTHRSDFELSLFLPWQADYQRAVRHVAHPPRFLWGRRSVFYFAGKPLLVNEIFLPVALE